jgi:hypothetical protein
VDEARAWWRAAGTPDLTNASLGRASPLSSFLPLLGQPPDLGGRLAAAMARVGHNHWVLHRVERAANRHASDWSQLQAWVARSVDAYLAFAREDAWKAAVSVAWEVIGRAAERTRNAAPSPLTL